VVDRGGLIQVTPAAAHGEVGIGRSSALGTYERERLVRRAKLLAWGGNAWHLVEFAIAIGAGIAAGSIALVGFGADSLIEAASGLVVVWLFTGLGSARSGRSYERSSSSLGAMRCLPPSYWLRRLGHWSAAIIRP